MNRWVLEHTDPMWSDTTYTASSLDTYVSVEKMYAQRDHI